MRELYFGMCYVRFSQAWNTCVHLQKRQQEAADSKAKDELRVMWDWFRRALNEEKKVVCTNNSNNNMKKYV